MAESQQTGYWNFAFFPLGLSHGSGFHNSLYFLTKPTPTSSSDCWIGFGKTHFTGFVVDAEAMHLKQAREIAKDRFNVKADCPVPIKWI